MVGNSTDNLMYASQLTLPPPVVYNLSVGAHVNFFRKKSNAFITLEAPDFGADTHKLWSDLLYTLEGQDVKHVTVRLYDTGDMPMRVLAVLATLGAKLKSDTVAFELEASPRIIQIVRKLNFVNAFSHVTEVA